MPLPSRPRRRGFLRRPRIGLKPIRGCHRRRPSPVGAAGPTRLLECGRARSCRCLRPRPGPRGSDLRGDLPPASRSRRHEAKHALRADQNARVAELPDSPSRSTSVHSPADGHQLYPSAPCRVSIASSPLTLLRRPGGRPFGLPLCPFFHGLSPRYRGLRFQGLLAMSTAIARALGPTALPTAL